MRTYLWGSPPTRLSSTTPPCFGGACIIRTYGQFNDTGGVVAPYGQSSGRMMVSWIITVHASPTPGLQKRHLAASAALTHRLAAPLLSMRPPMVFGQCHNYPFRARATGALDQHRDAAVEVGAQRGDQ